jgi:hypothetical protein
MILKFQDHNGHWTWITNVNEISSLGYCNPYDIHPSDYDCLAIEMAGESDGSLPFMILVNTDHPRLIGINAKEAYLCNDTTGSTVDVLIYRKDD